MLKGEADKIKTQYASRLFKPRYNIVISQACNISGIVKVIKLKLSDIVEGDNLISASGFQKGVSSLSGMAYGI